MISLSSSKGFTIPLPTCIFIVWRIQLKNHDLEQWKKKWKQNLINIVECYNAMLSFAVILDPRYKLQCVEFFMASCMGMQQYQWHWVFVINYMSSLRSSCGLLLVLVISMIWLKHHPVVVVCAVMMITMMISPVLIHLWVIWLVKIQTSYNLYLEETRLDYRRHKDLDVLGFAFEFAFSIGDCVFDKFCKSLLPQIAETLLCARDWLYGIPSIS